MAEAKTLKIARIVALVHIVAGFLLLIFGIVDRVEGYFWTGEGCFGIWCGIWVILLSRSNNFFRLCWKSFCMSSLSDRPAFLANIELIDRRQLIRNCFNSHCLYRTYCKHTIKLQIVAVDQLVSFTNFWDNYGFRDLDVSKYIHIADRIFSSGTPFIKHFSASFLRSNLFGNIDRFYAGDVYIVYNLNV